MKIGLVIGIRPEVVKMGPVIKYCIKNKLDYFVIHTGQHYSYNMDGVFFEELELPEPKYNLEVGSGTHGRQTAKMIEKIEDILVKEKPYIVLVYGDSNSSLAGALSAVKLNIKVGHIEAGLRSFDRAMPEEINRVVTDHISDFLFVPSKISEKHALQEGINKNKIFVTGNTAVDSIKQNLKIAENKSNIMKKMCLEKDNFFLATCHRAGNVDVKENLKCILDNFGEIFSKFNFPIVFPIHPRTKKMIEEHNLKIPKGIIISEPLSYFDFLKLEENAKVIFTDSGSIQEEACVLKVPCITMRENTERQETLEVGSNVLVDIDKKKTIRAVSEMINKDKNWVNPYGDGKTAEKIIKIIQKEFIKNVAESL